MPVRISPVLPAVRFGLMGALATLAVAYAPSAAHSAGGIGPVARAARTCTPPPYPGVGYFTTLEVTAVSCRAGRRLVLAYYRCRTRHGERGRCHGRVLGYACREKRNTIPTEIDARVTCRRRGASVIHTYQQDT